MKLERDELEQLQEQHLDDLIRLSCRYAQSRAVQEILRDYDSQPTAGEVPEDVRDATFARAMEKLEAQSAAGCGGRTRRFLMRFAGVAAVIALLLAVAAPIAVANIDVLRSRFGWFFFSDHAPGDDLSVEYHAQRGGEFAYLHPAHAWGGLYLPEYVPEGYIDDRLGQTGTAWYLALVEPESGDELRLMEMVEAPEALEGATFVRHAQAGGCGVLIERAENGDTVLTWFNGLRWYRLRSGLLPEETLLEVAGSLVPYAGQEALDGLLAGSVPGLAIPQGYAGSFFPAWTPEGFACTEVYGTLGSYDATFVAEDGCRWIWTECVGDSSLLDGNGGTPVYVEIGDATGALYTNDDYITILWMNETRMFHLKGRGMTQEEMLGIARSVCLIDRSTVRESIAVPAAGPLAFPQVLTRSDWTMPFVPTLCPESCFGGRISFASAYGAGVVYEDDWGYALEFGVWVNEAAVYDSTEYLTAIPLDIGGVQGRLTFSPTGAGRTTLYWTQDGYWFVASCEEEHADELLRLARSVRRGTPEEIALSPDAAAEPLQASKPVPMQLFPMALLEDYEVVTERHVPEGMTCLVLRRGSDGAIVQVVQLSSDATLLMEGGTDHNVTKAVMELAGRQVTVYAPSQGNMTWAPTVLLWREGAYQYMLLSTLPTQEVCAMVSLMVPVEAGEIPSAPAAAAAEPETLTPPAEWAGAHYITRMPEGYAFIGATATRAQWRDADGRCLDLLVLPEDWSPEAEAEAAEFVQFDVFGGHWSMHTQRFSEAAFDVVSRYAFCVDGCWYAFEGDVIHPYFAYYMQKIE